MLLHVTLYPPAPIAAGGLCMRMLSVLVTNQSSAPLPAGHVLRLRSSRTSPPKVSRPPPPAAAPPPPLPSELQLANPPLHSQRFMTPPQISHIAHCGTRTRSPISVREAACSGEGTGGWSSEAAMPSDARERKLEFGGAAVRCESSSSYRSVDFGAAAVFAPNRSESFSEAEGLGLLQQVGSFPHGSCSHGSCSHGSCSHGSAGTHGSCSHGSAGTNGSNELPSMTDVPLSGSLTPLAANDNDCLPVGINVGNLLKAESPGGTTTTNGIGGGSDALQRLRRARAGESDGHGSEGAHCEE